MLTSFSFSMLSCLFLCLIVFLMEVVLLAPSPLLNVTALVFSLGFTTVCDGSLAEP